MFLCFSVQAALLCLVDADKRFEMTWRHLAGLALLIARIVDLNKILFIIDCYWWLISYVD